MDNLDRILECSLADHLQADDQVEAVHVQTILHPKNNTSAGLLNSGSPKNIHTIFE
jgi:hypothetical protein